MKNNVAVQPEAPKVSAVETVKPAVTPVKQRSYELVNMPGISPKGKQRQIALAILATAKEAGKSITIAEAAEQAEMLGLKAVGGVAPSIQYHFHNLVKTGFVKVV